MRPSVEGKSARYVTLRTKSFDSPPTAMTPTASTMSARTTKAPTTASRPDVLGIPSPFQEIPQQPDVRRPGLFRGAVEEDLPFVQERDLVPDRERGMDVVGHDDRRDAELLLEA